MYRQIRREIGSMCLRRMGLDHDYLMNEKELKEYVKMENLMDLSYLMFQYYSLGMHSLVQQMEDILDRQMVCDDSNIEDVILYHHSYLFLQLTQMPEFYEEVIQGLCQMGSQYMIYQNQKEEFDTLLILEGEFDIIM